MKTFLKGTAEKYASIFWRTRRRSSTAFRGVSTIKRPVEANPANPAAIPAVPFGPAVHLHKQQGICIYPDETLYWSEQMSKELSVLPGPVTLLASASHRPRT